MTADLSASRLPRIFVLLASYRDVECQWSVKDLFDKASHPERVFIGICWQYDPDEDSNCFELSPPFPDQIRIAHFHWKDSRGVCWARNQAQQLWEAEEYVFITDAHMRFVPGWDDAMIAELAECPSARPVISCSPAGYIPPNQLSQNPLPTIRRATPFGPQGEMRFKGEGLDVIPSHPLNGAFIANGYVFARSAMLREVPIDPYLYFNQEECTYSARLWTHGWDIYHSRKVLSYHYYYDSARDDAQHLRPLHWSDNEKWRAINDVASKRYNHLFRHTESNDPEVLREIETYGMGTARSLDDYRDYCGLDYRQRVASDKALCARFIEDIAKYRLRPIVTQTPKTSSVSSSTTESADMKVSAARNAEATFPVSDAAAPVPAYAAPYASPVTPLERGDFLPMFVLPDYSGKMREIHLYAGKPLVIFCLPADAESYWRDFLIQLPFIQNQFQRKRSFFVPVIPATPEAIAALLDGSVPSVPVWADPERQVARLLGLNSADTGQAVSCCTNRNLQVQTIVCNSSMALPHCASLLEHVPSPESESLSLIVSRQAPVLLVDQVLSEELCGNLIKYWEENDRFAGKVGDAKSALNSESKRRVDCFLGGELLKRIDAALMRSLVPEVDKVFSFRTSHRELYKIGCYDACDKGFFQQHRDNFGGPVAHRRIAMSLNLGADYDGGEIGFPEYGPQLYRPGIGQAAIFPCALMHEVRPVTRGRRMMLVSFFFGEGEEQYRRQYLAKQGKKSNDDSYRFQAVPTDPLGLRRSVGGIDRK